ncbi:MAG TPA: MFS transporter, partial [Burkholderiaceae bacterium]|nr:MFS transporter [Burkholderiaceae bacterium]
MSLLQRVFVSILGSQLLTQALLFYIPVHVYRTTGQAADLGIVFFLEWLPAIAIFPFAGRWIRHLSPVSVLRAVAAVRAVLLLGIAAGSLVHPVPPVVMYAGLLVFSVTMSFYRLAAEMLSARQFTQGEAAAAQAKVQTTDILAFVIGPALGGLCVDRLALETMFALSALAFIGLHAFVNGLRPPMPDGAEQAHAEVGFMQTLRFLFGHPMLRAHMMLNFSINLV